MKILIALTYYRPHTSGLTIYAERLARALVKRGHIVRILTSRYSKYLARYEVIDGVEIHRAPVLFRVSKGVIMPTFGLLANRLVADSDVIHLHLPQFDAAGLAFRGRMLKKPTVITYHCDLLMPQEFRNWAANQVVLFMNNLAGIFTHRIVAYTRDYADHSHYLKKFSDKIQVISPPVELPVITVDKIHQVKEWINPNGANPVIGMAARFASEKGVEILLDAMPAVLKKFPGARVVFAGTYQNIIGEEHYFARLLPKVEELIHEGHWIFAGNLDPETMAAYYANLDVLVLPSLQSTESFGLVQIEAMINGIPCIASNLPGVRQPILTHKMGEIIPIGDSVSLAAAIIRVVDNRRFYLADSNAIRAAYLPDTVASEYEKLFESIRL